MSFQGAYHTVNSAAISPFPVQRPIPIWVGASAEAAVKRATKVADGYLPLAPITGSGGWEATMEMVDGWLREAGRDRASFGIEARLNATDGTLRRLAEDGRAVAWVRGKPSLRGNERRWAQRRGCPHPTPERGPSGPGGLTRPMFDTATGSAREREG